MRSFIYFIIFFAFFDLFAQLPIMSPFAVSLGAGPFFAGLTVGLYSLSNILGNILSGIAADRKRPFSVLIIGLLATGCVLLSYAFASDPFSLLAIRFFHGLAAGLTVPAAFTYLANRTASDRRGKNIAVSGAFIGVAAVVGPAYGAITASRGSVPLTMGIIGTLLLLLGLLAFIVLKSRMIKKEPLPSKPLAFSDLIYNRRLLASFSGAFFLMFSQGVLAYMLPLKVEFLDFDSELSGLLLSTFGIAAILVFLLPVNRVFDTIAPFHTLISGFALMGLSLFLLSAVFTALLMYLAMCIYGIGFALLFPSINSLLIDSTDTESRGRAYGYFYAFFSLGVVAGSTLTGALQLSADMAFLFTGGLLGSVALCTFLFKNQKNL